MIRLSVITPVRNLVASRRVDMFRKCVESVHMQKGVGDIEHLVVDGASTDGTEELLRTYADRGWIEVVTKPDRSIYEAMNNGLARVHGRYVLFLNSDDFLFNRTGLGKAFREVELEDADYCFGDVDVVNRDGWFETVWRGTTDGLPFAVNYCHQSMLVKTELLKEYGGFDLRYRVSSDSDLMLRLFEEKRRFLHSGHSFATYRLGGLSSCDRATAQTDHAHAFHARFGRAAGLSFEDCKLLWDFSVVKAGDFERARALAAKLPVLGWRRRLEEEIAKPVRPDIESLSSPARGWYRLCDCWQDGGMSCVAKAVECKLRKIIGRGC